MARRRRRKNKKYVQPISTKGMAKELIVLLAQGAGVYTLAMFAGPAGAALLAQFGKHALYRIGGLLKSFEKQKLIERQRKGRLELIKITDLGRQRAVAIALQKYQFKQPKSRDGKWRLVIFDVPEEARSRRDFLRMEFKRFGFHQLQKSVWVSPYDCSELFDLICTASGLSKCTHLLEVVSLNTLEQKMRRVFKL